MKAASTIVGLLAVSQQAVAVVDKWTPADFDWNRPHNVRYDVATQNMTTLRPFTKEMVVYAADKHNMTETDLSLHENFAIAFSIAATLRVVGWLSTAAGLVSTGLGCYEVIAAAAGGEQSTAKSKASCVLGIASSALGFGVTRIAKYLKNQEAAARLSSVPPSLPPPDLGPDFADTFELGQFRKRDLSEWKTGLQGRGLSAREEWSQYFHNDFTAGMIRDAKIMGEPEFLGYADDAHPVMKRSLAKGDSNHVLIPRFKFEHPKHGPMVLSTRFTNVSSHITVEPHIIGNPKIHKRYQEEYKKEVLENGYIAEARFDHEASEADPAGDDITLDEANTFEMAEATLHCTLGGDDQDDGWPLDQVMDVQFYDDTNKGTFGYATMGILANHDNDGDLGGVQPMPPITGGENC